MADDDADRVLNAVAGDKVEVASMLLEHSTKPKLKPAAAKCLMAVSKDAELGVFHDQFGLASDVWDVNANALIEKFNISAADLEPGQLDRYSLAALTCQLRDDGYSAAKVHEILNDNGYSVSPRDVQRVNYELYCMHRQFEFDVDDSLSALALELDICKATQQEVMVKTKLGPKLIRVPATKRQLDQSEEKPYWIEADRDALQSILGMGATLVRRDSLPKGTPVAPCVTHRRLKIEQATGELDKYKSRHCVDGARLAAFRARLGLPPAAGGTVNIIDDLALKLFLSDLAGRRRRLLKADVKDAYTKGKRRNRPKTYMDMPSTCQAYDEDGTPFVICLEDLCMWGESEAGYEWEQELHEFLLSLGWRQCIGVPAMYYFNGPDSDCRLVKIVDDLAFSDSADDAGIAMKTIKALKERYGEV